MDACHEYLTSAGKKRVLHGVKPGVFLTWDQETGELLEPPTMGGIDGECVRMKEENGFILLFIRRGLELAWLVVLDVNTQQRVCDPIPYSGDDTYVWEGDSIVVTYTRRRWKLTGEWEVPEIENKLTDCSDEDVDTLKEMYYGDASGWELVPVKTETFCMTGQERPQKAFDVGEVLAKRSAFGFPCEGKNIRTLLGLSYALAAEELPFSDGEEQ